MSKLDLGATAIAVALLLCPAPSGAASPANETAQNAVPPLTSAMGDVRLVGIVADVGGKPIAGATLALKQADGKAVATVVSDDAGAFHFDSEPAGRCRLSVNAPDYIAIERDIITPSAGLIEITLMAAPAANFGRVQVLTQLEVVGQLDRARQNLSPDVGADVYRFGRRDIVSLPGGQSTPLNDVLLQAPGVVQDSFGQLHIRGDHANVQYRLNGITLPESIAGFGQTLGVRAADQISLITGALPAEYGYRTAGIVDITTRGGALDQGGAIGYVGGSHQHNEGFAETGGVAGDLTYFVTATTLSDNLGIESPTADRDPLHDHTRQSNGLGYFSYRLNNNSRVSLIVGAADDRFQIPDIPGQTAIYQLDDEPPLASSDLDANQREKTRFAALALQGSVGNDIDYQIALIQRYSSVFYAPDPVGDLIYNGVAARIYHQNELYAVQGDLSDILNAQHTLRTGIYASRERTATDNSSLVFPADNDGNQTSTTPLTIDDNIDQVGTLFGVYLQDEWRASDRLTVNYGARYDRVNAFVAESQFSPRLGIVYQVDERTTLHAGYARYFTPPPTEKIVDTTVEKFIGTTNALPSDANTSVTSERSNYYDAGIVRQLTTALSFGVDAYFRDVKNLQDEGQFGNALLFAPFNYAKGKIYGAELSSNYRDGNFAAYANLAYSVAKGKEIVSGQFNFDPDELQYIADHWVHLDHDQTLSASFGASYLWSGATFSGSGVYGSGLRRGFANTEHVPGYVQVDVGVRRTFALPIAGKFDARITVVNVFDRAYELRDGTGIGVGAPQFGPRRAFYVSIEKTFQP